MSCKICGKDCKLPGDKLPIRIDLTDFCERRWDNRRGAGIYQAGNFIRPTPQNRSGYEYECTAGGQVGTEEPAWPTVVGQTVLDGSVEWTCRAISNSSLLKTIVSAVWDGDGFTVTDEVIVNTNGEQLVSCFISGDQSLGKYLVTVQVTFSDGHAELFGIEVKMSS